MMPIYLTVAALVLALGAFRLGRRSEARAERQRTVQARLRALGGGLP